MFLGTSMAWNMIVVAAPSGTSASTCPRPGSGEARRHGAARADEQAVTELDESCVWKVRGEGQEREECDPDHMVDGW